MVVSVSYAHTFVNLQTFEMITRLLSSTVLIILVSVFLTTFEYIFHVARIMFSLKTKCSHEVLVVFLLKIPKFITFIQGALRHPQI